MVLKMYHSKSELQNVWISNVGYSDSHFEGLAVVCKLRKGNKGLEGVSLVLPKGIESLKRGGRGMRITKFCCVICEWTLLCLPSLESLDNLNWQLFVVDRNLQTYLLINGFKFIM